MIANSNLKNKMLSLITFLVLAPSLVQAQDSTVNATTTLPIGSNVTAIEDTLTKKSPLAIVFGLEMAEKVQKEENSPKENSLSLSIEPLYKLTNLFTASAKIVINQDNFGQHKTTASDGTITLGIEGYDFSPEFKSVHSISTIVPVSDKSKKVDRLQSSLSFANGIVYSGPYFSLTYKIGLVRFFHEYTQNAEGSPNIQYRLSNLVDLTVPITSKFSINTVGAYRNGWTYGGFQRFGFIFSGDLNYEFNPKLTANLGISTDGSAVKSNGVDSNITVFDENTSSYRIGLAYLY